MIGLPSTTEFNKKIPKHRFYENLSISPALKRVFVEQIQSIVWANKIAPATIAVSAGEKVDEVEVFHITLTSDTLDESALLQMDKQIPYHILYVLEYDSKYQLRIGYKESSSGENAFKVNKYYHSRWLDESELKITIDGYNMDSVYEGFIRQIGNITAESNKTLDEQIATEEKRAQLEKQIAAMKAKVRKEKQFNRQVELNKQLKMLIKQLEEL